jgi:hypothetical protein
LDVRGTNCREAAEPFPKDELHKFYHLSDNIMMIQSRGGEVGGTRIAHERYKKCLQNFVENPERKDFEDLGRDEMFILRMILKK